MSQFNVPLDKGISLLFYPLTLFFLSFFLEFLGLEGGLVRMFRISKTIPRYAVAREDDLREAFPHTRVSSNDNLLKSIFRFQSIAELF